MPAHPPYTAPPDAPVRFGFRFVALMVVFPLCALVLWLVLPSSPVTVAITALAVLGLVFGGVGGVMLRRNDLDARPPRRPMT
jgi:hypothetical protein